jgi:amino acid transporter
MAMMVGVGPFITMPLFVGKMGGPHSLVVWLIGALVAICDGMVWAELAGTFPGAGGTFHFYDKAYGQSSTGRLLKFLFVWQFLFSAPLELASGAIGFSLYLGYLIPGLDVAIINSPWPIRYSNLSSVAVMLVVLALAWRNVKAAGQLMVILWLGMLVTVFSGRRGFNECGQRPVERGSFGGKLRAIHALVGCRRCHGHRHV